MEKNAPLLKQIRAAFFVKYIPLMLKAQQYISQLYCSAFKDDGNVLDAVIKSSKLFK